MPRPAKPAPLAAPDPEPLRLRVTKLGDGKIATGEHLPGQGDLLFERGETFRASPERAAALEALGLAEIVEGEG